MVRQAMLTLPPGHGPVQRRLDSGFYDVALMCEMRRQDMQFAISVLRSKVMWGTHSGSARGTGVRRSRCAAPRCRRRRTDPRAGRTETCVPRRRVRIPAEELSHDPRCRRRRTISRELLEPALGAGSSTCTPTPSSPTNEGDAAEVELWHRQRGGQMEERVKEVKLGCGLRHSRSGIWTGTGPGRPPVSSPTT